MQWISPHTLQAFLDALQNQAEASSTIIGQFGVGFYSAFMVADCVDVYTRSAVPDAPGYKWSSDGWEPKTKMCFKSIRR